MPVRSVGLLRCLVGAAVLALLAACGHVRPQTTAAAPAWDEARAMAAQATRTKAPERAARYWLRCAAAAYRVVSANTPEAVEAAALDTQCSGRLLDYLLVNEGAHWTPHRLDVAGDRLEVELRQLSPALQGPVAFMRAEAIPVSTRLFGQRFSTLGFGVALVASTPRCSDRPVCRLMPTEAVARAATAWVEEGDDGVPRLVFTDPMTHPRQRIGGRDYVLSVDTTAPYALLASDSQLKSEAILGLVGGSEIGRREGMYLLEDYDPHKIPVVMLHGLAASPLIWARLTNRIMGTPALRARYQVWHVVYPTDAPVLLSRMRVQKFLDDTWSVLDPARRDAARSHIVLVGHSMGGMIARLLTADSGDALWNAAFNVPPAQLHGRSDDVALLQRVLHFSPYPGVDTAFFLATPHRGSPLAQDFVGRLGMWLVRPHSPELDAIARLINGNLTSVQPDELADYRQYGLSSISTLRMEQPVSRAASGLLPVQGVRYYNIAGSLPGESTPGDGIVPLESTYLPGAVSTTTVESGHRVYRNDEAINLIVKVLADSP
jgi:pimeloyl-ACP methyl ester carboxylesterase